MSRPLNNLNSPPDWVLALGCGIVLGILSGIGVGVPW